MNIFLNFQDVQRRNLLVMEDVHTLAITIGEAIWRSNAMFTSAVQDYLYSGEFIDLTDTYKMNASIIAQLTNGDLTPEEACAQSNALWVERINEIRMPGIPVINTANFRSVGMSENF